MDYGRIELGRLVLTSGPAIARKAYMGNRTLCELVVPADIREIGDWAFAKCVNLKRVIIESDPGQVVFSRGVFDGCRSLTEISFVSEDKDLSYLAAACANGLPTGDFLLRDSQLGNSFWYSRWDLAFTGYLKRDDYDDYSNNAVCGEEDISFDGIASVDGEFLGISCDYALNVAISKCELCYMRLMHDTLCKDEDREISRAYIKEHTLGRENSASWITLIQNHKSEIPYFELYIDIALPDAESLDAMISALPAEAVEAKAYLIGLRAGGSDFFDDFSL